MEVGNGVIGGGVIGDWVFSNGRIGFGVIGGWVFQLKNLMLAYNEHIFCSDLYRL